MMKRLVSAKKLLVSTTAILAVGLSGQANAQEQGAEPELQDPNEIIVRPTSVPKTCKMSRSRFLRSLAILWKKDGPPRLMNWYRKCPIFS